MNSNLSGRPRRLVLAALALAAVAGLSTTAIAVAHDDTPATSVPSATPVSHAATAAATPVGEQGDTVPATPVGQQPEPGYAGAAGRFLELDPAWVQPGTTVVTDDGWTATITPDSSRLVLTAPDGRTFRSRLGLLADGTPNRLAATRLMLGQAGEGWVVDTGGDLTVITLRSDRARVARVTGGVPIGMGTTEDGRAYRTWFSGGVLRTAVALTPSDPTRVALYVWAVSGPGEGGAYADPETVDLVPTAEGTFCLSGRPGSGTVAPCEVARDEATLLPLDATTGESVGRSVVFGSGTYARLERAGRGLDLVVTTTDGTADRVAIPGGGYAQLITSELTIDGRTAYLVAREGGDSTALTLVVAGEDGLSVAPTRGEVPFGSGFGPDGEQYRTVVAGGGTALYTLIDTAGGGNDVQQWRFDGSGVLIAGGIG